MLEWLLVIGWWINLVYCFWMIEDLWVGYMFHGWGFDGCWLIGQPVENSCLVGWSVGWWLADWLTGMCNWWSVYLLLVIDWLVGLMSGWLIDLLICQLLIYWSVGWLLVAWLVGCVVVGWLNDWLVGCCLLNGVGCCTVVMLAACG